MAKKGLGKGLDSLIPDFYNEDFDSNSTKSLEDLMNEAETNDDIKEDEVPKEESLDEINTDSEEEETPIDESVELSDDDAEVNIFEKIKEENDQQEDTTEENEPEEEIPVETEEVEVEDSTESNEESVQAPLNIIPEHVDEVKEIVDKNPRITLWSSRSSAVFRYLRKTEPEFSISKEASKLIEEAVAKKYPEIWELFDDY
ncbi:MAG: AAA family ATPase [Methanobrevibacter sp.]|uniref:AAA family ATPase n=1 Tax=Methanobrevibacter sp. TaxID=66852 RepID=UPI003F0D8281